MLRSYKYRLRPTREQTESLEKHFGSCRLVWNLALAAKKQAYESNRVRVSVYDLQKQLVDLKKEYDWLYEINSQSLQVVLWNLNQSYDNFFKGGGFPKFKSKSGKNSFGCPQRVKIVEGSIFIPSIGEIKIIESRPISGTIKTATISKTPTGKYFASVLIETNTLPIDKKPIMESSSIGVDVGIKTFVTTSNGETFEPNRKMKQSLSRLKCLQRRASRKKKGSANRKKANKLVSVLHEKISNRRSDYIHKVTHALTHDSQVDSVIIESLNVTGLIKNRKLSKAIQDVSFGEFFRQMKYKCDWYGKNLIAIGMFEPSSKTCSSCGAVNQELTLSDREWTCECGVTHDRDFNAAKNIKNIGLGKYSGRGTAGEPVELRRLRRAKNQELQL